ncbi:AlpA family phage regulatory protein [Klebsiella pneumoniae]|uniref:AlpA family phage regulatory protein n=1 Tax=Klebsiella pneumoniae TaxID=573 RepID=UPI003967DBF5
MKTLLTSRCINQRGAGHGIKRSTIYDWLNPKSPRYDVTFPKQRRLGTKSVGWLESELDDWINNRPIPIRSCRCNAS